MKKTISFVQLFLVLGAFQASVSFADDAVTAPNVVAPAQPAAVQNVTQASAPALASAPAAGTATAAPAQAQQPGLFGMALPFLIMLGIMYFLMIRPQQKRMKEHQTLMSGLKSGDEVVTSAGIFGTISEINDKVVTLEVSKNVSLRVLKSQVNQVVKGPIQELQRNA